MQAHDTIVLPFEASSPAIARTRLASFLTLNRAASPVIDDALIVVSEMIASHDMVIGRAASWEKAKLGFAFAFDPTS